MPKNQEKELFFSLAGLQTDDTLNLGTERFMQREEEGLAKAKLGA